MKKLSTGEDATLGSYRKRAVAFWGEDARAVAYLDIKIANASQGADEEVLAEETQMVQLLAVLNNAKSKDIFMKSPK